MEDEIGLSFLICCQSSNGTFHACLSQNICENVKWNDRGIESVVGKYFLVESYHNGEIYFNLLPEDLDRLQRKLKIQMILQE